MLLAEDIATINLYAEAGVIRLYERLGFQKVGLAHCTSAWYAHLKLDDGCAKTCRAHLMCANMMCSAAPLPPLVRRDQILEAKSWPDWQCVWVAQDFKNTRGMSFQRQGAIGRQIMASL